LLQRPPIDYDESLPRLPQRQILPVSTKANRPGV
jgi:hypothetical protein